MGARLNPFASPVAGKALKHFIAAGKVIEDSPLPAATQELVKLRASQINGCGFCTDMHSKDAPPRARRRYGSTSSPRGVRRPCSPTPSAPRWSWPRKGTRIADAAGGVSDEVWQNAAKHYDEEQLMALVSLIALINSFNRMNVMLTMPAGDYQPGQFA
jgi:AhpD family alkylhydroperoxidase